MQKLIVLGVILVVVAVYAFLMRDSILARKTSQYVKKRMDGIKGKDIALVNAPIIYYKYPGENRYHKVEMTKKKFTIGRGSKCDLQLNDDRVEELHAILQKGQQGNRICYGYTNCAVINPSEYFVKKHNDYFNMERKEQVELDKKEAFYIGDVKVIIEIPKRKRELTGTEFAGVAEDRRTTNVARKFERRQSTQRIVSKDEIDI